MFESHNLYNLIIDDSDSDNEFGRGIIDSIFNTSDLNSLCNYYDPNEICNILQPNANNLFILHVNARSLPKKIDNLKILLASIHLSPDVICITESWLSESNNRNSNIEGYNSFHICRPYDTHGGVSILVKKNITSYQIDKFTYVDKDIEFLTLCLPSSNTNSKDTIISCVYRPASKHERVRSFTNKISNILNDPLFTRNKAFLIGDWNINLLELETHNPTQHFLCTMQSLNYFPLISRATRFPDLGQRGKPSLLDNIFVNFLPQAFSGILKHKISDHLPIFVCTSNSDAEKLKLKIKIRDFGNDNKTKFASELAQMNWDEILNNEDHDINFNHFITKIRIIYESSFPIKTKVVSGPKKSPWITRGIIKSTKTKFDLYKKAKSGIIPIDEYKIYKNKLLNLIRKAKKDYFYKYFSNYQNNIKKTWEKINMLIGSNKNHNRKTNPIKLNNKMSNNQKEIADAFNNYFTNIGNQLHKNLPASSIDPRSYLQGDYPNSMVVHPVSVLDVHSVFKSLKAKGCSIDEFSSEIVKDHAEFLALPIQILYNQSIRTGCFPSLLKRALVIPIHKKNSTSEITNYRPISILSIFSKIYEKLMKKTLTSYLTANNIISEKQFGFQSGISTYDAMEGFSTYLYQNLDEGKKVLGLFLDFKNAFDSVPHDILLQKLEYYGIRGNIHSWFKSYLHGRSQATKYGQHQSKSLFISTGLPQGSVLGPTLFNIYINDLTVVSAQLRTSLFCDDSLLFKSSENVDELVQLMNTELQKIQEWTLANRLTLNTDKTVAVLFSNKKIKEIPPILIKKDYTYDLIKRVDHTKFLGVYYDEHLKFSQHISHLCSKLSIVAGMLFRLKLILPTKILKNIYNSHVNSILNYCTPIWCSNYQGNINPVHLLQKRIIRCVTKSDFLAHSQPLFKKCKALNIFDINKAYLSKLYFKNPTKYVNPNILQHDHNTRNQNLLRPPRFTTTLAMNSFLNQGPLIYNQVPLAVKQSMTITSFKRKLKDHLLSSY